MQNDEQIIVKTKDDALAQAFEAEDTPAADGRQRRIDTAQQEWAREPNGFEQVAADALFQRCYVRCDVRELRHATKVSRIGSLGDGPSAAFDSKQG
jgi:hypothetical protein